MCARHRAFRLTPPASRKQSFTGIPLDRIDGDNIHIAIETAVLESVIQNEYVSEFIFFSSDTGLIAVGANDDGNIAEAPFHQKWFVSHFLPIRS